MVEVMEKKKSKKEKLKENTPETDEEEEEERILHEDKENKIENIESDEKLKENVNSPEEYEFLTTILLKKVKTEKRLVVQAVILHYLNLETMEQDLGKWDSVHRYYSSLGGKRKKKMIEQSYFKYLQSFVKSLVSNTQNQELLKMKKDELIQKCLEMNIKISKRDSKNSLMTKILKNEK